MSNGFSIPSESLNGFAEALYQYEAATGKDSADILNRAALNVAYRAAQFTPVATAAEIKSGLSGNEKMLAALTSISLRKRGIGVVSAPGFQKEMQNYLTRRVGSRRYLRSGWAPAIIALGGSFRGSKLSRGVDGYADKATPLQLLAEIGVIIDEAHAGKVEGAEKIGEKALVEAIDFVAEDMIEYSQDRLAKTAAAHSG